MLPLPEDLSLEARALWEIHCSAGRVVPAYEIRREKLAGNVGIAKLNTAMGNLKDAGLIWKKKTQNESGHWSTHYGFTDVGLKIYYLYIGYSPTFSDIRLSDIGDADNNIEINNNKSLEVLRTSNLYAAAGAVKPKGEPMAWEILGDEPKKKPKGRYIEEEVTGAVGKVVDKSAARKAKYAPTKIDKAGSNRSDIPESDWKTKHIVAEFNSLVRGRNVDAQMQLNGEKLSMWMNKMVGQGAQYATLLKAVRLFNSDPRNFYEVGKGKPIWQRFIGYYQTVQGVASAKPVEYRDLEFNEAHERARKLLAGSDDGN
jgi:hypothetical protein